VAPLRGDEDPWLLLDQHADQLTAFRPIIRWIRWGMVVVGLVLATPDVLDRQWHVLAWGLALAAYALWRTFVPLRYFPGRVASLLGVLAEVGLNLVAVVATGHWDSPYVFALISAIAVAGFARGISFAIRLVVASSLAVAIPYLDARGGVEETGLRISAQWTIELLLVALVASYARRLFGEAEERHSAALDRMGRLVEANTLLSALHRVAQDLPASLDLDEVLASTLAGLRDLFDFTTAVVLLRDDTESAWIVATSEGFRAPSTYKEGDLPAPLRVATQATTPRAYYDLRAQVGGGVNPLSQSGVYAALRARGALVGLIAIEHPDLLHFGEREIEVLQGFVDPVALAVENARWFSRLRTVGADEERTRIARDLHDRIGQSLAYLAFELDRIAGRATGQPLYPELQQLRQDVRSVVTEVRDTLYDLRTDVSAERGLVDILEEFLERVRERSGMQVAFRHATTSRPPLPQERELWRIAQEAITNVERHARARQLSVLWECDGRRALLQVADDGRGFPVGRAKRMDAYGMLGMRERADSIGARLDITSAPGEGTRVRCQLDLKGGSR
jgi:signal transduction histidine kinase